MFAIALWDASERRLLLARDRFGIKPLYYRHAGERPLLRLGAEGAARAAGLLARDRPPARSAAFLAFNSIPAPLTDLRRGPQAARRAPAGLAAAARSRSAATRGRGRWRAGEVREGGIDELAAELRDVLRDSVRAHLVADVPVGVLLSGGVDSSALAALAAAESASRCSTFSIGFEESGFDELEPARLVAERYGTDHHELVVRPDAVELLPKLVEAFDEPFADSSALPTYLVSELAAGEVKVALSGEGGDELFGGYYTYVADQLAPRVGRLATLAAPLVEALPSSDGKVSFDYKAKRFARAAAPAAAGAPPRLEGDLLSAQRRRALLAADPGWDPLDLYRERYAETAGAEPLARLQDVDLGIYLVDDLLVKTDRASMAHSLELRVPFLDQRVADLALALPDRLKVRGFAKKRLLRRALAPLLPREIVHGRKQGFSIPLAAWLRGPLEPFAREVLSPETLDRQGCLDPAAVHAPARRHVLGARGSEPAALGPDGLHPLVRPLCQPAVTTLDALFACPARGRPRRAAPGPADDAGWPAGSAPSTSPTSARLHEVADAQARRPGDPRRGRCRRR